MTIYLNLNFFNCFSKYVMSQIDLFFRITSINLIFLNKTIKTLRFKC